MYQRKRSNDQKKTSAVALLDKSKAFDSVNMTNDKLHDKLRDVGLSPSAIEWFRSYLSNRCQAVRMNTALSESLGWRFMVSVLDSRVSGPGLSPGARFSKDPVT